MKILMVGLGAIGQRHVRNLRALRGETVEISAFRARGLSQVLSEQMQIVPAATVEDKYKLRVFTDWAAALADQPDAVFICNPSHLHIKFALEAAAAGCHLFIEKPLSHNDEQIEALIECVERRRLTTFVAYQLRFHPCLTLLHTLLQQNAIGPVLAVRAEAGEYLPAWHPYEDYRQSYAARREMGGGVLLSQIHEFDYLYRLFGLPRRVFCIGGHLSHLEIDVEDVAATTLDYEINGRPLPVQLHQDYVQRPPVRTCCVIGAHGKIVVDWRANSLHRWNEKGELAQQEIFADFKRNHMYEAEVEHFLSCVENRQPSIVTVRDGAQSLKMALAAQRSLRTGRVEEL